MELHEKNITSISIPDPSGKGGGVLHYVPFDLGIAQRASGFADTVIKLTETVRPLLIKPDGTAEGEDAAALHKAEQEMLEAVNYVCGTMTAADAFKNHRPFAMVGDSPWAAHVCHTITKIVSRLTKELYIAPRTMKQGRRK